MKKLIIIAVMSLISFAGTAQNFQKYENMKDVDAMIMTSKMFKLLAKVDLSSDDPEAQRYLNLINNLKEIRVFTSSDATIRNEMATDVSSYLSKNPMDELMKVKKDGNNIKFYSKPGRNDDYVSQLFMFLQGEKDGKPISVIMSITGDIDLTQLSKLTSDLKVPGADELKNAKKKS